MLIMSQPPNVNQGKLTSKFGILQRGKSDLLSNADFPSLEAKIHKPERGGNALATKNDKCVPDLYIFFFSSATSKAVPQKKRV